MPDLTDTQTAERDRLAEFAWERLAGPGSVGAAAAEIRYSADRVADIAVAAGWRPPASDNGELLEAHARIAELEAALDESRGDAGRSHGQAGALLARVVELRANVTARDARIAELEAQRDRVTDLFEAWAAEENEHRLAGEHGLAEGLHVAIEMLRLAVHGTHAPSYPPGDEPTHPRTAGGGQ